MTAGKSRFDAFDSFIQKRHRWIIVAWIVLALVMSTLIPTFFASVSFNVVGGGISSPNGEAQRAQKILDAQFPSRTNATDNSILVVIQGARVYSDQVKNGVYELNDTLARDRQIANFTGMTSVYGVAAGLLNSTVQSLLPQVSSLRSNITQINKGILALRQNFSVLNANLFQLQQGINQTSQLVFGIPSAFIQAWNGVVSHGVSDPYIADYQANQTLFQMTAGFGGNPQSVDYYTIFYGVWNGSFQSLPPDTVTTLQRESRSVNQSVSLFLKNPKVENQTRQIVNTVSDGLNISSWNQTSAIVNLTISNVASQIPSSLSSSLGVSPNQLVRQLYSFGPSPSNATLANYAIDLFQIDFSKNFSSTSGFSVNQLLHSAYDLGPNPSFAASWNLSSSLVANATSKAFASSPLFAVNRSSLNVLLTQLRPNESSAEVNATINDLVRTWSYSGYPIIPERSITRNLVSKDNDTMIVLYKFSSTPSEKTIAQFTKNVHGSSLENQGTVYITGSPVIIQDVQNTFAPALGVSVGPGVVISLIIVGLLFLSPIAALIPVLLGGLSIAIGLPAIYLGVVVLGHGTITFLTPTLAILLMLGLAVDYGVLQLRRTREERQNGKSKQESVRISIRWAGQAVLTAGITVIVAYIVMAVANVPLFSDVGTAIALGVSILLAASLTLLPSLELALGDRIFWPGLRRTGSFATKNKSRLGRIAEVTLKRKFAIAVVISLMALGAFYFTFKTPVGSDFLKLVPDFPSNQGLTAIYDGLGGGTVAPTAVLVTTPTPIVYGHNQFNTTLLNEIELISDRAANSSGVATVIGPTRPFGSPFNYSSLQNMSESLKFQYQGGMLTQIGKDNKTALILVGLSSESESQAATDSLLQMEKNVNGLSLTNGVSVVYGGDAQSTYDSVSFIVGLIPQVIAILAGAVYVILLVQLRSALTPLRLIFTILCSVVFSLAVLATVFDYALKTPILDFAPLFVVVTMLGVGIDYDIFFVTRIREEVLNGKSDTEAIKTAVEKVWVTILGLGLILATVFASLLITNIAILQEISLAVSSAILIDVVVVILFFVPSLMGIAQRANWWPSKAGRRKTQQESTKPDA